MILMDEFGFEEIVVLMFLCVLCYSSFPVSSVFSHANFLQIENLWDFQWLAYNINLNSVTSQNSFATFWLWFSFDL